MKKTSLLVLFVLLLLIQSKAQDNYLISGRIHDSTNAQSLAGAVIKIKGSHKTVIANTDGSFEIKATQKLPITLTVSYIGYKTQEFLITNLSSPLSISLNVENAYVNEVVVTASRVSDPSKNLHPQLFLMLLKI